jgi:hypothetical protein
MSSHKIADGFQYAIIDGVLGGTTQLELLLGNEQGMVSTFDNVEVIDRGHLVSDFAQKIQRTEGIASSLYEQNWGCQFAQYLIAKSGGITSSAKRIAKADNAGHIFLQCQMASDSSTHALSDQEGGTAMDLASLFQRVPVRRDEFRQRIGTFLSLLHIRIVETENRPERPEPFFPPLHPGMRGRCTGSMRKNKKGRFHLSGVSRPLCG